MQMIERAAKAMEDKRRELIGSPLARIWRNLAEAAMEEALDKIDGLEADLDSAVEVAFNRGATEWVRMNYPTKYATLQEAADAQHE